MIYTVYIYYADGEGFAWSETEAVDGTHAAANVIAECYQSDPTIIAVIEGPAPQLPFAVWDDDAAWDLVEQGLLDDDEDEEDQEDA